MQSAKIAHYTHSPQSCKSTNNSNMLYIVHIVEQKWENLADRQIMCSHLTIFPRQQSFELSGQYHSRWQCKTYYNIRGTCIRLYLHWHYKLYHPLESERYSSTFIIFYSRNLTATCCLNLWLTCQLLTDSIGTLSKWYHSVHSYHMCAHTCISPTHTLTYYILVEINRVNWISLGLTCKE